MSLLPAKNGFGAADVDSDTMRLLFPFQLNGDFMKPDDELCLCFHVSLRKVVNWIRINQPRRPGQISECYGAGTGCGWCRIRLEALHSRFVDSTEDAADGAEFGLTDDLFPETDEYGSLRKDWIQAGKSAKKESGGD